jgi:hypothetical protein
VLDHPLGELLASIVGDVLLEQPTQQIAASAHREADRERELVAGMIVDPPGRGFSRSVVSPPSRRYRAGRSLGHV